MPERYCALIIGILFALIGVAGFLLGLVARVVRAFLSVVLRSLTSCWQLWDCYLWLRQRLA